MARLQVAYRTDAGTCIHGSVEEVLKSDLSIPYRKGVDLIFTSPPFPLNRKKKYGNLQGAEYIEWISSLAEPLAEMLAETGSIVMEMGNSWEPRRPVMSTLALEALLTFLRAGNLNLIQQFVWHNPARLPGPAQWVNVERIRVKDAYTHIWWMSASDRPKADNRRVLQDYSQSMLKLLESQKYNAGTRPSEHNVGETSFLTRHEGAIPSNVITVANTHAQSDYLSYCRSNDIVPHPARMPSKVAEFFINLLTEPSDLVMDPFAGSNTTGFAAETLGRQWLSIEAREDYIAGSKGRFSSVSCPTPNVNI